jgi:phage host-nuclease inhibitor protein Gam
VRRELIDRFTSRFDIADAVEEVLSAKLTNSELEQKAKRKRVKEYSTMTKDELVAALQ